MPACQRILFVHQNFPAQFRGLVDVLSRSEQHELAAIGMRDYAGPNLHYRRYSAAALPSSHDWVVDDLRSKAAAASGAAAQARLLKLEGFVPDVIVVHPGWGEGLYLRDIFPSAKIICYCEYYYLRSGGDVNFDPEFPLTSLDVLHRLRGRNAVTLACLDDANMCVSPTEWQKSTFPSYLHDKFVVIHEGIDMDDLQPAPAHPVRLAKTNLLLQPGAPIITYAARHLEPHRGFHTFMRALPDLLAAEPRLHAVVIGSAEGGYGAPPTAGGTWLNRILAEVGHELDTSRVHFVGWVSHSDFIHLLRLSRVHTYLTYPFVLSWSALEALGLGSAVIGSNTPPVTEFMMDGYNARIVDFFKPKDLADTVRELLQDGDQARRLGQSARRSIIERRLTRADGVAAWQRLVASL